MNQQNAQAVGDGDATPPGSVNGEKQRQYRDHITDDSMVFDTSLSFLDNLDDINALLDEELFINENEKLLPALLVAPQRPVPQQENLLCLNGNAIEHNTQTLAIDAPRGSPPLDAAPAVPPTAKPAATTTAHARQKAEIDYLRAQVVELEQELDRIIKRSDADTNTSIGEERSNPQPFVWEKIAKSQHEQRHRVEVQNIKLREQVEGQLRIARSLEKLLRKRSATAAGTDPLFTENKRARGDAATQMHPLSDDSVYKEIQQRIALQLDEVDEVLEACGLANLWTDTDTIQAKSDLANGEIFLETGLIKVMPFDLESVADAVFKSTTAGHLELVNGGRYEAKQLSSTMWTAEMTLTLHVRRGESLVHVKGVGCRRDEPEKDRVVIVFECLGGVMEGSKFTGDHILCREKGCMVIEKAPPAVDSNSTGKGTVTPLPSTVVKACARMWPEVAHAASNAPVPALPPQAGRFVDIVIGSYNQHTKTLLQAIENALLEQSRLQGTT